MGNKITKIQLGGVPTNKITFFRSNGKENVYKLTRRWYNNLSKRPDYHDWAFDDIGLVYVAYIVSDDELLKMIART